MSTESTPAEATSDNTSKRTVADEYRDAQAVLKKARHSLLFWLAFLAFAILNFGFRVFIHTANQLTSGEHDQWSIFWSIWGLLVVPFGIWMYGKELIDFTRSVHRLSLAEAAALKEAAKSETDA